MSRDKHNTHRLRNGVVGAAAAVACGLFLWGTIAGDKLAHLSYDWSWMSPPGLPSSGVTIVRMDQAAYDATGQKWSLEGWDRGRHARFVEQLRKDGCRMVVFDVWKADPGTPGTDAALAEAIRSHGRVVLAGDIQTTEESGSSEVEAKVIRKLVPPHETFLAVVGTNWGSPGVNRDSDGVVRKHYSGEDQTPSVPWIAAQMVGAAVTTNGTPRQAERWIRYYGRSGTLEGMSYHLAQDQLEGYFRDKVVFIGGKPDTRFPGEQVDEFKTPLTGLRDGYMPGVEIEATMFLNLMRGDWLERWPWWVETLLLLVCGALSGLGLARVHPARGALLALAGMVVVALGGSLLPRFSNWWFPWMLIGVGQIPVAWLWSVIAFTRQLTREKVLLEKKASRLRPVVEPGLPEAAMTIADPAAGPPRVHDYTLVRQIGKGAYGEVWVARNAVGLYRAVKLVFLRNFRSADPYDREFRGISMFMPVSLEHPGLVRVLHVGRNEGAGYFFYVMELADDQDNNQPFDPQRYAAKTLETERKRRGYFPIQDCADLGLHLSDTLEFLHARKLVHRDIKPVNIILVNGIAKLADVGLVTDLHDQDESLTYLGTPGYVAPEGPGTATADLYSLGKLLYVLCTGNEAAKYPELPVDFGERGHLPSMFLLNDIIIKACDVDWRRRYLSAAEMRLDLLRLKKGLAAAQESLKR